MSVEKDAQDVLTFWFEESVPEDWFSGSADFDAKIEVRFHAVHASVEAGEAWRWRKNPRGRLAEILVLDQFSRQLFRGQARAFASDSMALVLAQEAVAHGHDMALSEAERHFLYMPYMHSESLEVHREAERLFGQLDNAELLSFEIQHREVLERFGRYPARNEALGRISTEEELAYLENPAGSMF